MVKIFTASEKEQLSTAIHTAEQRTSAEIATVIMPISDRYIPEMMLYGFLLGSLASMMLWELSWVASFPILFLIQIIGIFSIPFLPAVHKLFLRFLPQKLLFHRASHLGAEELLAIHQKVQHDTPVVLLFISLAEHYVHLFPNAVVKSKVKDEVWKPIVIEFSEKLSEATLTGACIHAIDAIADVLEPLFPEDSGKNQYPNEFKIY